MRIGLCNTTPAWGGGERWFLDAAAALVQRGRDVTLVADQSGDLFRRARGIDVSAGSGSLSVVAADAMRDALTNPPPAVVITNSGRELRDALRAVGQSSEIRFVLRRGIDRPLHDHWFRRRHWRRLSAILVNSDATGDTIRRSLRWFPDPRIRRIYNPVRAFEAVQRTPADDGRLRLGAMARLVRQKGIEYLLRACARLNPGVSWSLDIAGDGKLRPTLERLAERQGIADRVRFLGHVDDPQAFHANVDTVIIPSLYEGFCFVAAEAAIAGLPVIASRTSSLPEIVLDDVTGILVPVGDTAAIAAAIERLAADRDAAARMGERARASAIERFAPEGRIDELIALIDQVAGLAPVRDL